MSTNGITSQRAEQLYTRSEHLYQRSARQDDGRNRTALPAEGAERAAQASAANQAAQLGAQADRVSVGAESVQEANNVQKVDSYEPANPGKTTYKVDMKQVMEMKAETEARMYEMVQKSLSRQITGGKSSKLFDFIRKGLYTQEDVAQAQRDVAENGYWGVEQTSDRIVKMAQALTGGDPSKLDGMMKAFEKGYKAAEKAMGGSLPDISEKTRQATLDKFAALKEQYAKQDTAAQAQRETAAQVQNQPDRNPARPAAVAAAAGIS